MQIIKLDATGSTNTHLKELLQQKELEDFFDFEDEQVDKKKNKENQQ